MAKEHYSVLLTASYDIVAENREEAGELAKEHFDTDMKEINKGDTLPSSILNIVDPVKLE